ncbi:hypothetical protein EC991_006228 [Linnemannia zychae]|nr:hypothetical protein EC991_006228 [Linnemannia zychae]
MKIITLSAVLCLAATTVLADKSASAHTNDHLSIAASVADSNKREARHHEINGSSVVKRADGPKGVNRHEHQKKGGHKDHGLEAHSDGGSRYHDKGDEDKKGGSSKKGGDDEDDDDEEDEAEEKEKKGGKKGGEKTDKDNEDKKGDAGDKKGDAGDKKGDAGDKKGDAGDKKGDAGDKKGDAGDKKGDAGDKKGAVGDKKGGAGDKKGGDKEPAGNVAAPAAGADNKQATPAPAAGEGDKKGGATNPNVPRDYASPLWLVQPYGSSVWAQGETYVVSWGPNPDPVYAKSLKPNTPVEIRLMQGPPDNLKEIAVLSNAVDSSVHKFEWLVPTTVTPATDYSIRMSHAGDVDTYSHYFEVVKAGDARSNKSNVGEPLQMPQKGDMPQPLNKGPINKPASPPNPVPAPAANTPASPASAPAAAKPAVHASSAHSETHQGANMLAFAMTLFGAVYFL